MPGPTAPLIRVCIRPRFTLSSRRPAQAGPKGPPWAARRCCSPPGRDAEPLVFAPVSPARRLHPPAVLPRRRRLRGILLVVEAVLIYSLMRFRRKPTDPATEPPQVYGSTPIEIAWTTAPALIVFVFVLVLFRTEFKSASVPRPPPANAEPLRVTVIGHQWWWEYGYEQFGDEDLRAASRCRWRSEGTRRARLRCRGPGGDVFAAAEDRVRERGDGQGLDLGARSQGTQACARQRRRRLQRLRTAARGPAAGARAGRIRLPPAAARAPHPGRRRRRHRHLQDDAGQHARRPLHLAARLRDRHPHRHRAVRRRSRSRRAGRRGMAARASSANTSSRWRRCRRRRNASRTCSRPASRCATERRRPGLRQ